MNPSCLHINSESSEKSQTRTGYSKSNLLPWITLQTAEKVPFIVLYNMTQKSNQMKFLCKIHQSEEIISLQHQLNNNIATTIPRLSITLMTFLVPIQHPMQSKVQRISKIINFILYLITKIWWSHLRCNLSHHLNMIIFIVFTRLNYYLTVHQLFTGSIFYKMQSWQGPTWLQKWGFRTVQDPLFVSIYKL